MDCFANLSEGIDGPFGQQDWVSTHQFSTQKPTKKHANNQIIKPSLKFQANRLKLQNYQKIIDLFKNLSEAHMNLNKFEKLDKILTKLSSDPKQMSFVLPELPYSKEHFPNKLSVETFDYHYGKHHQAYVNNLNSLIKGTEWENKPLDEIVLTCKDQKIFNNAAQHWNHSFYWYCMTPDQTQPSGQLKQAIQAKWGSTDKFLQDFSAQALANFGSGWTWLAKQGQEISIVNTSNAANPMNGDCQPLLTVDIWEHAYYIDYRNARAKYLDNFCSVIDWKFVEGNFHSEKVVIKM